MLVGATHFCRFSQMLEKPPKVTVHGHRARSYADRLHILSFPQSIHRQTPQSNENTAIMVLRFLSSLCYRLKPSGIKQSSPLLSLPLDIILTLEDFLSDVDEVALRLTCQALYRHKPLVKLTETKRAALLQLLERDHPKLYHCHPCNVLHSISRILNIQSGENWKCRIKCDSISCFQEKLNVGDLVLPSSGLCKRS